MMAVDSTQAFVYQWMIWRFFGLHPPEGDSFWARHYIIYSIAVHLFVSIAMPITFYVECFRSQTLTDFCETFYLLIILGLQQLKMLNVWGVRGRLLQMHGILRYLDGRLQSERERSIIINKARQSQIVCLWVFRLYMVAVASASLFVANSSERQLSFQTWIPWDWQQSRHIYLLTLLLLNTGMFLVAIVAVGNDTYPVSYLIMVAAHYNALAVRIKRLGNSWRANSSQTFNQMVECIEDHKTILKLLKIMENALSLACFLQFLCTATAVCSLTFFIFFVDMGFLRTLHLGLMLVSICLETYIICYASELVTYEAEQMSIAIYDCNWRNMPNEFRRIILIMLMRSQRPASIVALGFLPVRLTSLLTVFKGAYSMFTLLNEMNS